MLSDYRKSTNKEIWKETPETFLKIMRELFLENEEIEFSQKIWTILRDKTTQDLDYKSLEEDASSCVKKLIKKEVEEEIKKKLHEGELITDIEKIKDELVEEKKKKEEIKDKLTEEIKNELSKEIKEKIENLIKKCTEDLKKDTNIYIYKLIKKIKEKYTKDFDLEET